MTRDELQAIIATEVSGAVGEQLGYVYTRASVCQIEHDIRRILERYRSEFDRLDLAPTITIKMTVGRLNHPVPAAITVTLDEEQ